MSGPIRIAILANGRQARAEATLTARAYTGLGRTLAKMGAAGGLAVLTAKAVGFAKASVNLEAQYSTTMRTIQASSGASEKAMERLNTQALKLGQDTAFSANDAADAMLELSKAGIRTRDILGGGVAGTLQLAAAGGTQLGTAATIASNAMNAFNLSGRKMDSIAAALAGGANASTASVESLGQALSQVGPGAVNAGLNLQETVGALSAFDAAGVKGSDAGTSLKTMLARLVPQTTKASDAMEKLGLDFVKGNGEFESLTNIAGQLQQRLGKLSAAQRTTALNTIFGSDASRAATVLMRQGADGIRKFIKATRDQNAAQKMAEARMGGTAGALERLSGSIETAQLRLGQELAPVIQSAADGLGDSLVPAMEATIDGAKELGRAVAPAVEAIVDVLGDLIPEADEASSIFHDQLIPAVSTLADIVASTVGLIDDLPGPIKEIGVQAGIAALVLPRLTAGVTSASGSMLVGAASARTYAAALLNAETRSTALGLAALRMGSLAKGAAGIGGLVALTQSTQQSSDAMGILSGAAGGAALGFSMGGPWGALIGGAGGGLISAISRLGDTASDAADDAATSKASWAGLRDTLDQVTGATTAATRAFVYDQLERSGVAKALTAEGISRRTAVAAVLGEGRARKQVQAVMIEEARALDATRARIQQLILARADLAKVSSPDAANYDPDAAGRIESIDEEIEALGRQRDAQKATLRTIQTGISATRRDIAATRAKARATQDLTGLYGKLPKRVVSQIEATGINPTVRGVARVAAQYKAIDTRKEIRAVIEAAGVDTTVREVKKVQKQLQETGNTRANLSTFTNSIRTGTEPAKQAATTGGNQIGGNLQSGVLWGFAGTASALAAAAASAVRGAVAAARAAAKIKSPSQEMRDKVGKPLAQGLVVGFIRESRRGEDDIKSALDRLMGVISSRLDSKKQAGRRRAILRSLKDERAALIANGKAQDRNNRLLEKAKNQYKDLAGRARDFATGIKSGYQSYGSVVGLGTTGGGTDVTLSAMLSQLTARAEVADKFAAVIATLRGQKLNETSLRQILDTAASGDLEGALATATAIASGGATAVAQINELTKRIGKSGRTLGDKMKTQFYGAGLQAAEGLIDGLKKKQRQLDKRAEELAESLIKKVKKALGIKSPSTVFREIGDQTIAGLGLSFKANDTYVKRMGATAATSLRKGFATPALDAYMSTANSAAPTFTVQVELTAQQLSEMEKGRKIQVSLDAYHGAGGRTKVRRP